MKMSRERARRAADQRKAEDDLSSLTSYWTNTVLTGAQMVAILTLDILNLAIEMVSTVMSIGFNLSHFL